MDDKNKREQERHIHWIYQPLPEHFAQAKGKALLREKEKGGRE